MKRIIVLIVFAASLQLFAQTEKGKISLTFNNEKMDVPITSIMIRKENAIIISLRADKSDSTSQKIIAMELPFKDLNKDNLGKGMLESDLRIQVINQTKENSNERRFSFNYGPKNMMAEFTLGYERMMWQNPSMQFKISVSKIDYTGNSLVIEGSFSGIYKSSVPMQSSKTIVEIKDGYFQIIL